MMFCTPKPCAGALFFSTMLPAFVATAQSSQTFQFDLPAQPLELATTQLARQTGLIIGGDGALLRNKQAPALLGEFTARDALQRLLVGSGLGVRFVDDSTVTLVSEQADTGPITLAPIRVKGELQERNLQDTQTSVAVITGEQLERRSDPDLYTLIERTPGVVAQTGENGFSIRGIRQAGPSSGFGNGLLVSTVVDGATISNFGLLLERGPYSLWDLEQVEVLRGPQSTQSGRNALAGAVNIRSKDPQYTQEFKFRAELGQYDTRGAAIAYNQPLKEETLAVRVSAETRETEGAMTNVTQDRDDAERTDNTTVRLSGRWDPSDTFSAILKYSYIDDFAAEPLADLSVFPNQRVNAFDADTFRESETDTLSLRLSWQLSPTMTLLSESVYMDSSLLQRGDTDFTPDPTGEFFREREFDSVQQEFKLTFQHDAIQGVAGVFYTQFDLISETGSISDAASLFGPAVPPDALLTFASINDDEVTNYAIFGEIEYQLSKPITLVAGFRYDEEEFTEFGDSSFISEDPIVSGFLQNFPARTTTLEGDYSAFLPKLGLVYQFHTQQSVGFTVQRGYRAGGTFVSPTIGPIQFDPEYTTNYELSYRAQSSDGSQTLNANAYFTDWTDMQVRLGDNLGDLRVVNSGESEVYGFEIDWQMLLDQRWELFASAAYARTEFTDFVDGDNDFTGNEFPDAPEFSGAFGATYLSDDGWYASVDASFTDSTFGNATNLEEEKNDQRTLVNVRVGYESDQWDLFVYARNLLDKDYVTSRLLRSNGIFGRPGEPRTVGLIVNYRY